MSEVKLNISYEVDEGLVINPSELYSLYLNGIPLCYPNGGEINEETIKQKIKNSQRQIENFLSIKLIEQEVEDNQDFVKEEYKQWGYIKGTWPIKEPIALKGYINEVKQVDYPKEWLSIKRTTDKLVNRNLFLIPNTEGGAEMTQHSFIFSGITPHMGFFGTNYIPNYWRMQYVTGWNENDMPDELIDVVAKLASVQVLAITGDLIYGAGIGNQSISIDGISQTYSTTKGGGKGAFAGRIQQYTEELQTEFKRLKAEYLGVRFRAM